MKLSDLLPGKGIRSEMSAEAIEVYGVSDHTEHISHGDLFIAKEGARINPLYLLHEIEARGARAILLSSESTLPYPTSLPCFYADDLSLAVSTVWEKYYGSVEKGLRLVGVTGTNGKTTTALILSHLLNASGILCGYIGTLGARMGEEVLPLGEDCTMTTPSPRLLHKALHEMAVRGAHTVVLEVSSHALALGRVAGLHFSLALFTNLGEDHLDFHKTTEAYFAAKSELFRMADHAVINIDDAYGERLFHRFRKKSTRIGVLYGGDFSATDLYEGSPSSTQYVCVAPFGRFALSYPLFGGFHVYNTLLAVAAATHLGLCPEEIRKALLSLPHPRGRLERITREAPFSVYIDYAHTPDAMKAAIAAVRRVTRGRLTVVFGAGGEREKEKRPMMGEIAEKYADFSIVTGDNSRSEPTGAIIADILSGMRERAHYTVITNRRRAIERAFDMLREGDSLLLLGKGHEEYMEGPEGKIPFSEREIVLSLIKKKGVPL